MSWRKVTLGDLVDSFSIRAKDVGGGSDLPFYGVSNEDGITKSKFAAEEKADDYKIIEKSCFAYNPYRVNVGSIALLESEETGLISPAYVVFKPKPRSIIPKLLLKFLKSDEGLRQIRQYARGTVRQALRFEDLCKIELSIPDYEQQEIFYERIANVEREGKKLSTELTNQFDLVKQLRQAFLREAMQGKLVNSPPASGGESEGQGGSPTPPSAGHLPVSGEENASILLQKIKAEKAQLIKEGKLKKEKELPPIKPEEIPFDIPKNWVWCRLGEVVTQIFDGPFGSHLKTADYKSSGIQVIRLENLGEMDFKREKETFISKLKYETIKQHTVYPDDIIIGSFLADGVRCVVLPELEYTAIAKADCFTIRIKHNMLINKYVMFLLSSSLMFVELSKLLRGMTRLRINTTQLKQLPIPLPPLSVQHNLVTKLQQLMRHCDELEQSIKLSQTQNEQLLQQVLREALRPSKEYKMVDELSLAAEPNLK